MREEPKPEVKGPKELHESRPAIIFKYLLVAIFVAYRSFSTEEHPGMTMENIKGCVFNTIKFSEGTRCKEFRRDFSLVSLDIADYYLYKVS